MLFNCGVGEDAWESLGLQGYQSSQSQRKSVLNIHCKDWCWNLNSNTLATWWEELTHWKRPWFWEDWRQEEKGVTEDEIVGCHYRLHGHEFVQAPGVGDWQGSLACWGPWSCKESDIDWETELIIKSLFIFFCVCVSCSVMSDSLWSHILYLTGVFCLWNSPGRILDWVSIFLSRASAGEIRIGCFKSRGTLYIYVYFFT